MRKYFEHIKPVCPYSLESYDQDRLLVLNYELKLIEKYYKILDQYDAFLFKCHPLTNRDSLISIVQDLNDDRPDAIWFWSHPDDEHYSTPVPSIIMQNKVNLRKARKEHFKNGK